MKKLSISVVAVLALLLTGSAVARAGDPGVEPTLTAMPASGVANFPFELVVEPCVGGENILFSVPGDNDVQVCGGAGATVTSKTFTAPAAVGIYQVTAVLYFGDTPPTAVPPECGVIETPSQIEQTGCLLITLIEVVPTPTTTTTVPDTTTTTTTVPDTTTTTVPMTTTPAPTTTVALTPQLPATGGPDASAALFASLLLVLGGGLVVLTRSRMHHSTR